jgi:hypothetical protein
VLHKEANLVILSMSSFVEAARSNKPSPNEPDLDTLSKWLVRLEPIIRDETKGEIICVFANRTGHEDEILYTGTSAVLGIHRGQVKVYGMLGCGEEELLIVDTNQPAQRKLVREITLSFVDVPQKFFVRTPSAKLRNTSGTRQPVTVPRNVPSHIPSWLPPSTWNHKVVVVSVTQAKECDKEFWGYLSHKVLIVDPRYVVIRTEGVEGGMELDKFHKIMGPGEKEIVAIHAYIPKKNTTFQHHYSTAGFALYHVVDENQVSFEANSKDLGISTVQQEDGGDAKPWHNGEGFMDSDLIAVYDLDNSKRPVTPKLRNSSLAPVPQEEMLQSILKPVLPEEVNDEVK